MQSEVEDCLLTGYLLIKSQNGYSLKQNLKKVSRNVSNLSQNSDENSSLDLQKFSFIISQRSNAGSILEIFFFSFSFLRCLCEMEFPVHVVHISSLLFFSPYRCRNVT